MRKSFVPKSGGSFPRTMVGRGPFALDRPRGIPSGADRLLRRRTPPLRFPLLRLLLLAGVAVLLYAVVLALLP